MFPLFKFMTLLPGFPFIRDISAAFTISGVFLYLNPPKPIASFFLDF